MFIYFFYKQLADYAVYNRVNLLTCICISGHICNESSVCCHESFKIPFFTSYFSIFNDISQLILYILFACNRVTKIQFCIESQVTLIESS